MIYIFKFFLCQLHQNSVLLFLFYFDFLFQFKLKRKRQSKGRLYFFISFGRGKFLFLKIVKIRTIRIFTSKENHIGLAISKILWYRQTHTQSSCYFYMRIPMFQDWRDLCMVQAINGSVLVSSLTHLTTITSITIHISAPW